MPVGGAAQFSFEPAVLRTKLAVASCLPDVGHCQDGDDGDDAEPTEVGGDHAEHDHQQDRSAEQLVERVDTLIEHGLLTSFQVASLGYFPGDITRYHNY